SVDTSDDTQVLGNTVRGARTYGIESAGSQRVTIRGNTVDETGVANGTGIALTGINATSHSNILDQNHLTGVNRGIQLNVGANDNTITAPRPEQRRPAGARDARPGVRVRLQSGADGAVPARATGLAVARPPHALTHASPAGTADERAGAPSGVGIAKTVMRREALVLP